MKLSSKSIHSERGILGNDPDRRGMEKFGDNPCSAISFAVHGNKIRCSVPNSESLSTH
jgi:hypothetical protein